MKKSISILGITAFLICLIACKKDDGISHPELEGTWVGEWGIGSDVPVNYEKWIIKPNGKLTVYTTGDVILANGDFHLDDDEFEAEYTPFGLSSGLIFSGFFDEDIDEISGTWGYEPSSTDGGAFEMRKQ